ncbi:MAG TPA: hypothetical protein VL563_12090 [Gemmatimonadales bacterium]|jgi:hypothetical protein|nr:hypothetical protein [Gemmatimonadales bacterium]
MAEPMNEADLVTIVSAILLTSEYTTKGPTEAAGIKTAVNAAVALLDEVRTRPRFQGSLKTTP